MVKQTVLNTSQTAVFTTVLSLKKVLKIFVRYLDKWFYLRYYLGT